MNLLKTPVRLLIAGLFATTSLLAADVFEGRVKIKISDESRKKEAHEVSYSIKGQKQRMDVAPTKRNREAPVIIFDFEKREMLILMDQGGEKVFMRRPLSPDQAPRNEAGSKVSEPVATGKTETILGYQATEYTITSETGEITNLWLAKGLGKFLFPSAGGPGPFGGGRGAPSPGWEKVVRDGGFYPLRVVTHSADGKETMHLDVTGITQEKLPDSVFSTDGYTEMQIPDMGGMGGMNPFRH